MNDQKQGKSKKVAMGILVSLTLLISFLAAPLNSFAEEAAAESPTASATQQVGQASSSAAEASSSASDTSEAASADSSSASRQEEASSVPQEAPGASSAPSSISVSEVESATSEEIVMVPFALETSLTVPEGAVVTMSAGNNYAYEVASVPYTGTLTDDAIVSGGNYTLLLTDAAKLSRVSAGGTLQISGSGSLELSSSAAAITAGQDLKIDSASVSLPAASSAVTTVSVTGKIEMTAASLTVASTGNTTSNYVIAAGSLSLAQNSSLTAGGGINVLSVRGNADIASGSVVQLTSRDSIDYTIPVAFFLGGSLHVSDAQLSVVSAANGYGIYASSTAARSVLIENGANVDILLNGTTSYSAFLLAGTGACDFTVTGAQTNLTMAHGGGGSGFTSGIRTQGNSVAHSITVTQGANLIIGSAAKPFTYALNIYRTNVTVTQNAQANLNGGYGIYASTGGLVPAPAPALTISGGGQMLANGSNSGLYLAGMGVMVDSGSLDAIGTGTYSAGIGMYHSSNVYGAFTVQNGGVVNAKGDYYGLVSTSNTTRPTVLKEFKVQSGGQLNASANAYGVFLMDVQFNASGGAALVAAGSGYGAYLDNSGLTAIAGGQWDISGGERGIHTVQSANQQPVLADAGTIRATGGDIGIYTGTLMAQNGGQIEAKGTDSESCAIVSTRALTAQNSDSTITATAPARGIDAVDILAEDGASIYAYSTDTNLGRTATAASGDVLVDTGSLLYAETQGHDCTNASPYGALCTQGTAAVDGSSRIVEAYRAPELYDGNTWRDLALKNENMDAAQNYTWLPARGQLEQNGNLLRGKADSNGSMVLSATRSAQTAGEPIALLNGQHEIRYLDTTIKIARYDVVFNVNGGTSTPPPTQQLPADSLVTAPATPTRQGYTFNGWYTQSTGGSRWNFGSDRTPQRLLTLYAQWTQDSSQSSSSQSGSTSSGGQSSSSGGGGGTGGGSGTSSPAAPAASAASAASSASGRGRYTDETATSSSSSASSSSRDASSQSGASLVSQSEQSGELVRIEEEETPQAGIAEGAWALLNLILAIFSMAVAVVLLVAWLVKRREEKEEREEIETPQTDNEETQKRKRTSLLLRLLAILCGALAPVLFLLTENILLPMIIVDRWTLWMVVIALVQVVCFLLMYRKKKEEGHPAGQ